MDEKKNPPLTGFWQAWTKSTVSPDWHGHYIEARVAGRWESTPVIHYHKGGRRAHFHEESWP